MVTETNRYTNQFMQANPGAHSWATNPIDVVEMKAFVALLLAMGISRLPQYHMYWSTSQVLRIKLYSTIMPRNCYLGHPQISPSCWQQCSSPTSVTTQQTCKTSAFPWHYLAQIPVRLKTLPTTFSRWKHAELQRAPKFCAVYAKKTCEVGTESFFTEWVYNRLHICMETLNSIQFKNTFISILS